MDFVLSKVQKALASIMSFFMVDSTDTATCLLPQRDYPSMPQTNGSLEISPIWHVLAYYQVRTSPILWHAHDKSPRISAVFVPYCQLAQCYHV